MAVVVLAFQLINSSGLSAYYRMASGLPGEGRPHDDAIERRFREFDQDEFQQQFSTEVADGLRQVTFTLDGIHCAACVWLIEKLPQIVPGVIAAKLNWSKRTVAVTWQTESVQLSSIAQKLNQLGYTPFPFRENESEQQRQRENRRQLIQIGIAAAAAGNNMIIAASLYLGMFSYMSSGMHQLMRIASCIVGLAALAGPGRVFLRGAWTALQTRTPHMDLPIALGLTVGSVVGLVNVIRGSGEIYFDSLSVLIFLLLVGRWIQFRQQNRAADSIDMLYRLTPRTTRKLVEGRPVETFVDSVVVGDLLEIKPGELIPVDAEITRGASEIDESILSGESRPLLKQRGDQVSAGTQNRSSVIVIRASATGTDTRLSKIVQQVEEAASDKPEIVQWADRIGGYFVIAVVVLAALTFAAWLSVDLAVATDRSVALLIVACPCALALATPLAIAVAIGRAARRKIMIKGGDVLQRLNRPGVIWLDKTGTITNGQLQVVSWHGEDRWLPAIACLESKSTHPVGRAIVTFVDESQAGSDELEPVEFREIAGRGLMATIERDHLVIGNAKLMHEQQIEISPDWLDRSAEILEQNLAPCWVAANGVVVGMFALGDFIRRDTIDFIQRMKQAGWKTGILSGDHESIVQDVARRLDIDDDMALGGLSPEEKVRAIHDSLEENATTVMVGDGVNDSAALALASVGVAVHNGAEASLAAAPVYLGQEGLQPVYDLVRTSQSTNRIIKLNFAVSLAYNVCGATLAFAGLINPLIAAILMPISSLTVVAVSLTAGRSPRELTS